MILNLVEYSPFAAIRPALCWPSNIWRISSYTSVCVLKVVIKIPHVEQQDIRSVKAIQESRPAPREPDLGLEDWMVLRQRCFIRTVAPGTDVQMCYWRLVSRDLFQMRKAPCPCALAVCRETLVSAEVSDETILCED